MFKDKKVNRIIIITFIIGIIIAFIGLAAGESMASFFSSIGQGDYWSTSGALMNAFTYIPFIAGRAMIIVSMGMSLIVFKQYYKTKQ